MQIFIFYLNRSGLLTFREFSFYFILFFISVGCIFAELLNMQSENVKTFEKRRPLFPGER
jgi:hypothetical protein